jgi:hypothetical protein
MSSWSLTGAPGPVNGMICTGCCSSSALAVDQDHLPTPTSDKTSTLGICSFSNWIKCKHCNTAGTSLCCMQARQPRQLVPAPAGRSKVCRTMESDAMEPGSVFPLDDLSDDILMRVMAGSGMLSICRAASTCKRLHRLRTEVKCKHGNV